jgi:hypothetical protein
LRWILFEVYYAGSLIIDLSILQAFYYDNILIIRIFFMIITCFVTFIFFLLAFMSALIKSTAHSPYKLLNSIIAESSFLEIKNSQKIEKERVCVRDESKITTETNMKMNNLIERLAQTEITVWCLDLFPLNFYELYLFVAAVASNLFLFIGLIKT